MSWSIYAVGNPVAVAKKIHKDAKSYTAPEPEEGIRAKLIDTIIMSLSAYPADIVVQVKGNGHQTSHNDGVINQFSLEITPIYGFVKDET